MAANHPKPTKQKKITFRGFLGDIKTEGAGKTRNPLASLEREKKYQTVIAGSLVSVHRISTF